MIKRSFYSLKEIMSCAVFVFLVKSSSGFQIFAYAKRIFPAYFTELNWIFLNWWCTYLRNDLSHNDWKMREITIMRVLPDSYYLRLLVIVVLIFDNSQQYIIHWGNTKIAIIHTFSADLSRWPCVYLYKCNSHTVLSIHCSLWQN